MPKKANPTDVAVDRDGNVYIADRNNHQIRVLSKSGVVSTLAGLAGAEGSDDGSGQSARFRFPRSIALDPGGNLIVADRNNYTIRKVTPSGEVTTLAGSPGEKGRSRRCRGGSEIRLAREALGLLWRPD